MSLDDNKAIARRFIYVWAPGGDALVDELADPAIKVTFSGPGEPIVGAEAFKQALLVFHAQMPDAHLVSEDDIIAEGDKVVIRWTASGTYAQEFGGLPTVTVTGKQVTWTGITIFHIVDGKVLEEYSEEDLSDYTRQLGLTPNWTQTSS